jgi:hypothetical protein
MTPRENVGRQLLVNYAVMPVQAPDVASTDEMLAQMDRVLTERGYLKAGDTVVFLAGKPVGRPGTTNLMKPHRIGDAYVKPLVKSLRRSLAQALILRIELASQQRDGCH